MCQASRHGVLKSVEPSFTLMSTSAPLRDTAPLGVGSLCIAVLTYNEAERIEACLRSTAFAQQVVVVDSGSSDDTCAIAARLGAQVISQPDWQGFGPQRNHQIAACRAEYIFMLDADEEIGPALRAEILRVVASGEDAMWRVDWEQVAFGQPLTHMDTGGATRLFKASSLLRFEGAVHENAVTDRPVPKKRLKARLLHHSRNTVRGSLEKMTQYAMLGAAKRARQGKKGGVWRGVLSGSTLFFRLYVWQRGFLCGGAGFLYCWLVAQESFFRQAAIVYDKDSLSEAIRR